MMYNYITVTKPIIKDEKKFIAYVKKEMENLWKYGIYYKNIYYYNKLNKIIISNIEKRWMKIRQNRYDYIGEI